MKKMKPAMPVAKATGMPTTISTTKTIGDQQHRQSSIGAGASPSAAVRV